MRIGTITCNNADNYGARLQAFALYHYLRQLGYDTFIIDYKPNYMRFRTHRWYWPGLSIKNWGRLLLQYKQRCRTIRKHERLDRFSNKYTSLSRTYNDIEDLRNDPPLADLYIAGSDQIWNTEFQNGKDPAFYLNFGPESTRRISYAASFATTNVPLVYSELVKTMISKLDAISVREASAVGICNDLGYSAIQVCDPVWLIDADYWANEIADHTGEGERYVLVYDFMHSDELRCVAERTAKLRGAKIYAVSPRPAKYADHNYCDCGAEEFVSLVKNAECVVSNSLHGSLFSMLFKRDFYVVNRRDGLNQRMRDLLSHYNLSERIVKADCDDRTLTATIDYKTIIPQIEADVAQSKEFLTRQLNIKK